MLCWIKNRHERFKQFVEERCKSIRDKTNWSHVKGIENPADLTTREILPSELKDNLMWLRGPNWS